MDGCGLVLEGVSCDDLRAWACPTTRNRPLGRHSAVGTSIRGTLIREPP
jgi:hypothetical protein